MLPHSFAVVASHSSPEIALLESNDIEPGYYAEVIGASFERCEQVRIRLIVGLDHRAITENNLRWSVVQLGKRPLPSYLIVLDTIAYQTISRREE